MWARFLFQVIFVIALSLAPLAASGAQSVKVIDGDTLDLDGTRYRLFGIDAPEAGQKCKGANGKQWKCGKAASDRLRNLVSRHVVKCDNRGLDPYGRVLAVCTADDANLNLTLIEEGLAWAFVRYSNLYEADEAPARTKGVGVWQAATQSPWDYREDRWKVEEQVSPKGCPIKGNISKNGHIYHVPWSRDYAKTEIDTRKGERWFCTESEALSAGWRAPSN